MPHAAAPKARARRAPRALTAADKSQRREAILTAADALLRSAGFEDFSMEVLAKQLGLARGTLYLYFATREEVLLTLYEVKRAAWCESLLDRLQPGISDDQFVRCWYRESRADPLFVELRARLESVIEHNVGVERLAESKRLSRDVVRRLSERMSACLAIDAEAALQLIISFGALLIGASRMDVGPPHAGPELADDERMLRRAMSGEHVFHENALLILEGMRRRSRELRD